MRIDELKRREKFIQDLQEYRVQAMNDSYKANLKQGNNKNNSNKNTSNSNVSQNFNEILEEEVKKLK